MRVMTWKHTPSQGAGLGLLVSFIETTLHLTVCIHSPYHAGNYVKDFTFAPDLKKKKKSCVCSFHTDFLGYKHTKQN